MGTPSDLSIEIAPCDADIVDDDPLEWLVSGVKKLCCCFYNFVIPCYEFLFTRIGL